MSTLVLIPWAKTDWTETGRLFAETTLPLNESGVQQVGDWAESLAPCKLQTLYTSEEQTSLETAAAIAHATKAKIKRIDGLKEVSFGLWAGLSEESLKARFPKVYKRWKEDPTSVCPPEGESLVDASTRLRKVLHKATRKAGKATVGVVLGPFAWAIARCEVEDVDMRRMREFQPSGPAFYEEVAALADDSVTATPAAPNDETD